MLLSVSSVALFLSKNIITEGYQFGTAMLHQKIIPVNSKDEDVKRN